MTIEPGSSESINNGSINNGHFSHEQIIAHCLREMTFYGFDQAKIQTVLEELNKTTPNLEVKSLEEMLQADDDLIEFGELLGIHEQPKTPDEITKKLPEEILEEMVRLNQKLSL
jgi:hypothetical protein